MRRLNRDLIRTNITKTIYTSYDYLGNMNSEIAIRENSNSKKQFIEDVVNAWLSDNEEFTLHLSGGEDLRLSDYHDIFKETYDEDADDWDSTTLIECVEFYEIDDYFISLVCPSGTPDILVRIPLDEISYVRNESTGEEKGWRC